MERIIYSLDIKSINDLCVDTLLVNSAITELRETPPYPSIKITEKTKTYSVYGRTSDTIVKLADLLMSNIGEVEIKEYYKAVGGESRSSHAYKITSYSKNFSLYRLPDQEHCIRLDRSSASTSFLLRYSINPKVYLRQVNFAVKAENIIPGLYFVAIESEDDLSYYKILYVPMEGCDKKVLDSTLNFLKKKEGGENDIRLLEALEKRTNEILYES